MFLQVLRLSSLTQLFRLGTRRAFRDDPEQQLPVVHDGPRTDRRGVLDAAAGGGRNLAAANLVHQPLLGRPLAFEPRLLGQLARLAVSTAPVSTLIVLALE